MNASELSITLAPGSGVYKHLHSQAHTHTKIKYTYIIKGKYNLNKDESRKTC